MNNKKTIFSYTFFILFTLTGCIHDKTDVNSRDSNAKSQSSSSAPPIIFIKQEAAGKNCIQGGSLIETGIDLNANSSLDEEEITKRNYICNGKNETNVGSQISLTSASREPSGSNCPQGGALFETGIDINQNNALDAYEIVNTDYLCNWLSVTEGEDNKSQLNLVSIVTEFVGNNCPKGGLRLETGPDLNGNLILDVAEVSNAKYICDIKIIQIPENITPDLAANIAYVILLSDFISKSITVRDTANVNISLKIDSSGYNANNPLVIKLSDDLGYFPTTYYSITDFFGDILLPLTSVPVLEATTISSEIKIEFCKNIACNEKVYGTKTTSFTITVDPVFTSATLLTQSIKATVPIKQFNKLNIELNFDAEGFTHFNPIYVSVSDDLQSFKREVFSVYGKSKKAKLAIWTKSLYETGEFSGNLLVDVCDDHLCANKLQDRILIPVNLIARNPIVFSSPVESTLTVSQTVLEPSAIEYEINLISDDSKSNSFWVNFYDPSGRYFKEKTVNTGYRSKTEIQIKLVINPVDVSATEAQTFQIKSRVCMDLSCNTVISPELGSTEVTLNVLYPSAELTVNETSINATGKDNTPKIIHVTGNWQASNIGALSTYLVATDIDGGNIIDSAVMLPQKSDFVLPLELLPQKKINNYTADIGFKICLEPSCDHIIGTSANTVAISYDVNQLAGWTTHQRNAEHNGYIPITLDKDKFIENWTWSRPISNDPVGGINPVVAQDGKVVLSYDVYYSDASIVVLDEATGKKIWENDLGNMKVLNPPAITEGKVWAAATSSEDTRLYAFGFNTGNQLHNTIFGERWAQYPILTPYGNSIYQAVDYYGGYLRAYSTMDGQKQRETSTISGSWRMYTPAISGDYLFHHNGEKLFSINRVSGKVVFTIDDNLDVTGGKAYFGSPVIYNKTALAYAGQAFSRRLAANVEQYDERQLSAFDLIDKTHLWNSTNTYLTQPAVKDGVVYIGSKSLGRLDALDINTGEILWSWTPSNSNETELHRNTIVTDNLVFVSTNLKVHAIDLDSKLSVWSYPSPGLLTISESKTLFIVTGMKESDGNLVAIKLE